MGMRRARSPRRWPETTTARHAPSSARATCLGASGSASRILRMLLQSAMLGLGAYLVIHGEMTAGAMIAASIMMSRALAPIEIADRELAGLRRRAAELSAPRGDRCPSCRPQDAGSTCRRRRTASSCRTSMSAAPALRCRSCSRIAFALPAGEALGIIGPSGSRQVDAGPRPGRRLADLRGDGAPRRRRARPVEARGARPAYRLPAAGRRALRRHRRGEHRPLRTEPEARDDASRRPGRRRPRDDPAAAGRLRHADRRRRGDASPAASASAIALARALLRRPVPDRSRRAECQPRRRRRRGAEQAILAVRKRAAASSSSSRTARPRSATSISWRSWRRAASRPGPRTKSCDR